MNSFKNWLIVILGIACLGLYWLAQHKNNQLYTVEQCSIQDSIEFMTYFNAVENLLDETCDYVEERYEDYLPDTLWEGDAYDEYAQAFQLIKSRYVNKIN